MTEIIVKQLVVALAHDGEQIGGRDGKMEEVRRLLAVASWTD